MSSNLKMEFPKKVTIKSGSLKGTEINIEGYWHRITGKSWMEFSRNPVCSKYLIRSDKDSLPKDNNVLYGDRTLIHVSEI